MANTYIRTERVRTPGSGIDDTKSPPDHDANAVDLLDTIGYICSQVCDITGEAAWETAPDMTIAQIAAKTWLDGKMALRRVDLLQDITIPNAQNWKILSVAGSELPTGKVKATIVTTKGLIVKLLAGGAFNAHSLDEVGGETTLSPKNLCLCWDGDTGDEILSSGRKVYALLQGENGATDGTAFTDVTPERAQVSFVRPNATYDDLEAVPVADIQNKKVNLSFVERQDLASFVEQDFLADTPRVDLGSAGQQVTLDNAIDNQGATPCTQATDIEVRIADTKGWFFDDPSGARDLLAILPNAAGDEVEMNVDALDINVGASGTVDIDNGITVDSAGTAINLGVTPGQIDAGAAALKLLSTGAAVTVDGVGVVVATNTGDFTVNATQLVVDQSASRVGINTATPGATLEAKTSATNTELIRLNDNTDTAGIFLVDNNPNAAVTGQKGSIAMDYTNGKLWLNTTGAQVWVDLYSGGFMTSLDIAAQAAVGTSVSDTPGALAGDVDLKGVANQINVAVSGGNVATFGVASTLDIEVARSRANTSNAIDLDTATNGIQIAADAEVDINAGAGVTVDGTTIAITGTDTSSFTVSANSAAAKTLTLEAANAGAGTADVVVKAKTDITLWDARETAGIDLTDVTTGSITGLFGGSQASIAAAIKAAAGFTDLKLKVTVLGSPYAQGVNVPGAVQNLTLYPIDMGSPSTVEQLIFLNGELMHGGLSSGAKNDVYNGSTPASGDIMFDFPRGVKAGDVIISVSFARA
jgi:hypothetical protein